MSKASVRKYLQTLDREALEEVLMDLYATHRDVKNFLDFIVKPDEHALFEKYRAQMMKEFFPKRGKAKARFSVGKRIVKEFRSFDPDPLLVADLLLCIIEFAALHITGQHYNEAYANSLVTNSRIAVDFIAAHDFLSEFEERIRKVIGDIHSLYFHHAEEIRAMLEEALRPQRAEE